MMSSKLILVQQGAPSGVPLSTVGYHFGYRFGNHYEDCLGDHYGEHFGDRFKDPFGNHFGYFLKHVEKMQKSLMYFYFWKGDCSGIVGKCAYYPTCSKETLSMLIPQFVAGEYRIIWGPWVGRHLDIRSIGPESTSGKTWCHPHFYLKCRKEIKDKEYYRIDVIMYDQWKSLDLDLEQKLNLRSCLVCIVWKLPDKIFFIYWFSCQIKPF